MVLVVAYTTCVVVPNVRHRSELQRLTKALQSLSRDRIQSAFQSFTKDRSATNVVMVGSTSLEELVSGGYLRSNEAQPFGGAHVDFFPAPDDRSPQMLLAAARSSGGQVVALLSDGSVQQLTEARYRAQVSAQVRGGSQQDGAANRGRPVGTGTNRTSAAAGPGG